MNVFQNELTNGRFLSVYDETEQAGSFHVCRFLCCDEVHILFQAITTRGYDDGFYLIPLDCVYRVDMDDEYTERIALLFQLHEQPLIDHCFFDKKESLLLQMLRYAQTHRFVISLFLENEDDITGRILDINTDGNSLCIEKLTESGKKDGTIYLDLRCIEKIICNSGVERCIEMLSKHG